MDWARFITNDRSGPIIILDLKMFKVWIEPEQIYIFDLNWLNVLNWPGPIDTLDLKWFKN